MSKLVHILGMDQLVQQHISSDVCQTCVLAGALVSSNLIPYQATLSPPPFLANPLGNAHCSNTSGLSYNDATIALVFGILVQYVLRNLSGFTTASCS